MGGGRRAHAYSGLCWVYLAWTVNFLRAGMESTAPWMRALTSANDSAMVLWWVEIYSMGGIEIVPLMLRKTPKARRFRSDLVGT